jgi:hypothetical protein
MEKITCHPLSLPVGVEEANDTFRLLKRLDQPVQQQPVETTIGEANAMLVMLGKGVHGNLPCGQIPGAYSSERLCVYA